MVLAMQGTPWDAKGKLATHIPTMGGAIITPAAVTANTASSGRAEGSTDRAAEGAASTKVKKAELHPEEE
eukprot:6206313-Amphidinium_carterae.1